MWSFWTLNDALSFLKVFGTVAWTLSEQFSGQWFDRQAEHEMTICCSQCTSCKSDKVEIHLVSKKYFFLSCCNSNAWLDRAPTKILSVALIVSLVLQSGTVLGSATANFIR